MEKPNMVILLRYWEEHLDLRDRMNQSMAAMDVQAQRASAWMIEHGTTSFKPDHEFEIAVLVCGRDVAAYGMDFESADEFARKIAALEAKHAGDI